MSYHLLVAVPGGAGHIFPTLGVVHELVRQGHRVTVVTTYHFADAVAPTGARFVPYPSEFEGFDMAGIMAQDNAEELLNNIYVAENEAMLRTAEQIAAADEPDAVVYEVFLFIAGKLLATKLGRPGVRLNHSSNEHYSIWEEMRKSLGQRHPEEFESTRQRLTALLAEYGIDRPIRVFWEEIDDLNIAFIPRSFQIAAETFDERFVFTGPCFTPQRLESRWRPPDGDPPILLVSLGSTWNEHPEFFRACANAFDGTPWHVVLAIGQHLDPDTLAGLPANVEVHPWVSFVDVLKHASVFITQGTGGAVMESLYRGCPMLIFSHFAPDALPIADRTVAMGLGHALHIEQFTPEALRKAVTDVAADEDVAQRIADIRDEILRAGGAPRAASAIVEHVARARS